ncbi:M48 family metallopeptidase [Sphingomonas sp. URHD0057]|uniref:M48 family metallopeptidase n=1 Tax=Sphingomonas sp. URHD0057 TaxID=1380389 RepID=UPI000491FDFF|nr:SprT family zinc-dependent metalloprotease [Sphingomonas sp. URHD0057]
MWSTARSEDLGVGLPVPIEIRVVRSARRLRLRFDEVQGTLKLTCPPRTTRRAALAWALDQRDWIDRQLARAAPFEPFAPGAPVPIEGAETEIRWQPELPRTPALIEGELRCGGPQESVPRRIETWLKKHALEIMSRDVAEYAAAAGVTVRSVAVGDAGTRWGSCSSDARIRLSWRLILAPPEVRRYVAAHEVAHLKHMNHGPEFKAFEATLFGPGLAQAKAQLRRLGPRLRRIGRG